MNHEKTYSPRLLRMKQVQALTGLSRTSIYDLSQKQKFPRSIPLVEGGTSRAWLESSVYEWIDQRVQAGKQEIDNA